MPVYQYEGQHFDLPDGLSNEQAIAKIKSHLGQSQGFESQIPAGADTQTHPQPEATLEDKIKGLGETALNLGTGAVAGTVAPLVGAAKRITGGSMQDAEKSAADTMEAMTYAPRTAKGQDYSENVGEVVNRYLMPIAPLIHGVPQVPRGALKRGVPEVDRPGDGRPTISRAEQMLAEQDRPPVSTNEAPAFTPPTNEAKPIVVDRNGVATDGMPDMATELAKQRAEEVVAQGKKDEFLKSEQGDLFEPYTNSHREFDQLGNERKPLTFDEYKETVDNLAKEPSTAFKAPEDLEAGYKQYQDSLNEKQGGLFDPATRANEFSEALYQDTVPAKVQEHPFVKKANERVETASRMVEKVRKDVEAGKVVPTVLMRAERDLEGFKAKQAEVSTNLEQALRKKEEVPPMKGFNARTRKQGGGINVDAISESISKLTEKLERLKASGMYKNMKFTEKMNLELPLVNQLAELHDQKAKALQGETATNRANELQGIKDSLGGVGREVQKSRMNIVQPNNKQRGGIKFDFGDRKNEQLLKGIPGLKEKLKDVLPDQRTNEEFLAQEAGTKDLDQNLVQKGFNYLTKGGVYQTLKTQNPLIKRVVDRVLDADNKAKALIGEVVHDGYAPAARALSPKEKADVWAIIDLGDKEAKSFSVEQMKELGLNDKQIKFAEVHSKAMDIAYKQMAKAMEAAGVTPVSKRTAYAAFRARGDFRKVFYKGVDEKGNPVPIGVVGSNTHFGLERDVKRLQEKFPDATVGEERYYGGTTNHTGTEAGYGQALELLSKENPAMREFIDALNDLVSQDAFNYMDAKKHTMAKKGVWGMEGRSLLKTMEQNAKDGMEAQVRNLETMLKWGELSKAVEESKALLDKDNGLNMPNAKAYLKDYMDNALGVNPTAVGRAIENLSGAFGKATGLGVTIPTKIASAAKTVTNGILLGFGNVPFLVTNMIQPFKVMPEMKAWMESKGLKTGFDAGTGYAALGKATIDMYKEKVGKPLSPVIEGALKYAKENHVYSSDLFEAGNTINKGTDYYWTKGTQMGAAQIEQVTRKGFYLATVNMLADTGLTPKDGLYQAARRITDMGMNNYSHVEAPMAYNAAGGLGKMAYNLVSYKHNELSRLSMFAREVVKDKSAKPLAVNIMSQIAFAGIKGTILYKEADEIIKLLSEQMGEPTSLSKILLESKLPDVMKFGMFSAVGLDTTSRLGLTVTPDGLGGTLFPGGSKLLDGVKSTAQAVGNPTEFNVKNAIRDVTPLSVTGPMDRAWFSGQDAQGNELSMNRKKLEANAVRNDNDKMWKSIGATGINESKQKSEKYENDQISLAYQTRRQGIMKDIAQQYFMSGKINPELTAKYIKAEGDPTTLVKDIQTFATKQKVPAQTLQLLKDASSNSITALKRAQREKP